MIDARKNERTLGVCGNERGRQHKECWHRVAVGRTAGFALIRDTANALGGTVGSSRAAVDAGCISHANQVGLTVKNVVSKLYIACGIS